MLLLLLLSTAHAADGFAADLLMDSGHDLTQREQLYAAEALGLSYDVLLTDDIDEQTAVIVGDDEDPNGALLYPDGAPRYRVIYTNGGSATGHGTSLGEQGRQRVRDFVAGGGSYTGSCAGAFLTMLHYDLDDWYANGDHEPYYHLWPAVGESAWTGDAYHDLILEQVDHPMLAPWPSLADGLVEDVRHNYGCRLDPDHFDLPEGTELLGLMDAPSHIGLHGFYNILIYKGSDEMGRVVVTCSHPESHDDGEQLDLTAAILDWAIQGQGSPWADKGSLTKDQPIAMDQEEERLGDGQLHHWVLELPQRVEQASVTVGELDEDVDLYLRFDAWPDREDHDLASEQAGTTEETIALEEPQPGRWYVAVYGDHDRLAGAAYTITASWTQAPRPGDTGLDSDDDGPPDWDGPRGAQAGCGCGSPGSAHWLGLLLALPVALRRRHAH
jgi:hypothetical protein